MPVDFLLEIGSEEIPHWMIPAALDQLAKMNLFGATSQVDATPRRLVVRASGLPEKTPDEEQIVKGPPVSAGDKAAAGFAKKQGVDVSVMQRVGDYYELRKAIAGRPVRDLLAESLPGTILGIQWPKAMYWTGGKTGPRFIRPIRWLVGLLGDQVIPFEIAGVKSGNITRGHRKLGSSSIPVTISNYESELRKNFVILSSEERRKKIETETGAFGAKVDPELLETLTFITEYPTAIKGGFDPAYLELPAEVLTMVMRHHQKYFSVEKSPGELAPYFVAVMNTSGDPDGLVQKGNERVLKARFNDARFFWKADLERTLYDRVQDLDRVTFHAKLGSYLFKTERLKALVADLGGNSNAESAAYLSKADLTTEMVKEFTDLQGIMGGLYAKAQGEPEAVWRAVYEHYKPLSMEDSIPATPEGQLVALADKLDTLQQCFRVGLAPTGSKDPFALRRAAQGVVRILVEAKLEHELNDLSEGDLREFLLDRIKYYFREIRGFKYDEVNAVLASGCGTLPDVEARLTALAAVRPTENFEPLAASFKRIQNILKQAAIEPAENVDITLFEEGPERELYHAFEQARAVARGASYQKALEAVASLRPKVDAFFDKVLVNAKDEKVRVNRLTMLHNLLTDSSTIADFSEIVTSNVVAPNDDAPSAPPVAPATEHPSRAFRRKKVKNYVYNFGGGHADGDGKMKEVLGGKGAGLAEMSRAGIPVPPGFTISTEVCNIYFEHANSVPSEINQQVLTALGKLEAQIGKKLGDPADPLLVSVRSGAKFSMPGMMNTILNLGLNDKSVEGLAKLTGNPRFAYDSYRRFIQMFGEVALNIPMEEFDHIFDSRKAKAKVKLDTELTAADLKAIIADYLKLVQKQTKKPFPQDPHDQLAMARDAVFRSWWNAKAAYYRKMEKIPDGIGTAANVQAMVYGNLGDTSATGVGFTRDPGTGEKVFYGEFLVNAQGEDVVAGIRTPQPISELEQVMPAAYKQLREITNNLEQHYRDMQDFEFTIQENKLYMLQTRNGKRTGPAAVRVAVEMMEEGLIDKKEAVLRVQPQQLDQLLHPVFDAPSIKKLTLVANGIAASPGAAVGRAAFSADDAVELAKGGPVILVRKETTPDDIHGMDVSKGILTAVGGKSSHAAVVARGMGRPCVVGAGSITISERNKQFDVTVGGKNVVVKEGDWISLDGTTANVYLGKAQTNEPDPNTSYFGKLMKWADEFRGNFGVRANADIPRDAKAARTFGAEGIGLCRTEHMFFAEDRIPHMQAMILARDEKTRKKALLKLLPMQRADFAGLFKAMDGFPVVIRTLDPPLHEFLPKREDLMVDLARLPHAGTPMKKEMSEKYRIPVGQLKKALPVLLHRVEELHEFNPMLGHRGCRLGITYPDITEMQARAIFEAAVQVAKKGVKVLPEVMIPLIGNAKELENQKAIVDRVAKEVLAKAGMPDLHYMVGTMIEIPRAAITADEVAKQAEFFSFGTNDLTQTTMGLSRDDYTKFSKAYEDLKIFKADPFASIDQEGVGKIIEMAIKLGRSTRPDLEIGICGEHGGDPASVEFCYRVGMNYVSCSPYRVPIARLAAAQAAVSGDKSESMRTA